MPMDGSNPMGSIEKVLLKFLAWFLFIIAVLSFALWWFQRSLMYFPSKEHAQRRDYHAEDMQEIILKTKDNLSIKSWYKPPTTKALTIVYFHGNGGHLGGRMPLVRKFIQQGYGVLLLSYRGYGGNPGKPTELGLYADAQAAMDFVQAKSNCVMVFGESLGTGVASKMASDNQIQGLILQTPFTSMVDAARFHYPYILIEPTDKYDTLRRINKFEQPLLVIHGKKDSVVPFAQGQKVFEAAMSNDKQFLVFDNKHHHDLWSEKFLTEVMLFLKKVNNNCKSEKNTK